MENSPLSFLPLVVMSVLEEIQLLNDRVDTTRGWTFEWLKELLQVIPARI